MPRSEALDAVWGALQEGGVVVAYGINAHHRSVGSVAAFLVERLGFTVARVAETISQHPWQQLADFDRLKVNRHMPIPIPKRHCFYMLFDSL